MNEMAGVAVEDMGDGNGETLGVVQVEKLIRAVGVA